MALKRLYPTPTIPCNMAKDIVVYTPGENGPPASSNVMATDSMLYGLEESRSRGIQPVTGLFSRSTSISYDLRLSVELRLTVRSLNRNVRR